MRKILRFLLVFLLFSCDENKPIKEEVLSVEYYSDNKTVKAKRFRYSSKSGVSEMEVEYYPSGDTLRVSSIIGGLKEGTVIEYSENGDTAVIQNFEKGKENGWSYWLYPNGSLTTKVYYTAGVKQGEGFAYFKSGLIKTYLYYYKNGELAYRIDYSPNGSVYKVNGNPLPEIRVNDDSLMVGDHFNIGGEVVGPPAFEVVVKKRLYFPYLNSSSNWKEVSMDTIKNQFLFDTVFGKPGIYELELKVDLVAIDTVVTQNAFNMKINVR